MFTKLQHDVYVDVESYLASRGVGPRLERFEIGGSEAFKALHDLDLMQINHARMFPDVDGAARYMNLGRFWRLP